MFKINWREKIGFADKKLERIKTIKTIYLIGRNDVLNSLK